MAEEDGFDDAADGFLVGFVEVVDGFEVEGEVVCGAALVLIEEERVCAGVEGECEIRESIFTGPNGVLKFESSWQVTSDGFRLETVIPFGGG